MNDFAHQPSPPSPGSYPGSLSVVALDDDPDFRQFIQMALENEGHEARVAATPDEFYAMCTEHLPDIALLDLKMGRVDGATVLEEIRRRWPRLCVVVVTGYPSLDSMRSTFKQDVFDYLAKPFSLDELRRTLAQAAETYDLGRRPIDRVKNELGRQIRIARTARGWTLKDLSDHCGVSVSQLSSVERGSHLPSMESLLAMATALEQRPSEWLAAAGV